MRPETQPRKGEAVGLPEDITKRLLRLVVTPDAGLTPLAINALLVETGNSAEGLAKNYGCHNAFVYQVITRKRKNRAIRDMLASAIGLDFQIVWGEM